MAEASITSPRCSVCRSEHRVLADSLMASGAELRATARRFGFSKSALARHYEGHVSTAYKASVKAGPFGSEENLRKLIAEGQVNNLETLEAYRAIIGQRIVANMEVNADNALIGLMKVGQENVALHAKLTGGMAPTESKVTISVLQDPRTVKFVTLIMGLVRKHPDTREDVAALVRECFGTSDGAGLLNVTHEASNAA